MANKQSAWNPCFCVPLAVSGWLGHFRKDEKKNPSHCPYTYWMQFLVDRAVLLSLLLLRGRGLAGAQAHQRVPGTYHVFCGCWCAVALSCCWDRVLGARYVKGARGFSGCHTLFVPVEWIGRISFTSIKPCQNYKKFWKRQTEKPVLLCLFRRKKLLPSSMLQMTVVIIIPAEMTEVLHCLL